MTETKNVCSYGCTIYSLNGFPGDGADAYSKAELDRLREKLKDLSNRSYICSVNSRQKKAKELLEEAGFKVIARTYTAHIDGVPAAIAEWKKSKKDNDNTIYLMGKGFYKRVKKEN